VTSAEVRALESPHVRLRDGRIGLIVVWQHVTVAVTVAVAGGSQRVIPAARLIRGLAGATEEVMTD
jgi:hypothetical protein